MEANTHREEDVILQTQISRKRGVAPPSVLGFINYLFLQFMAFIANFAGTDVVSDPEAEVVEIWSKEQDSNFAPRYSTALDGDFPLSPAGDDSREWYLDLMTKDGPVTVRVSKQVHDDVSYSDTVHAYYQIGRFDSSKLNGKRVTLLNNK